MQKWPIFRHFPLGLHSNPKVQKCKNVFSQTKIPHGSGPKQTKKWKGPKNTLDCSVNKNTTGSIDSRGSGTPSVHTMPSILCTPAACTFFMPLCGAPAARHFTCAPFLPPLMRLRRVISPFNSPWRLLLSLLILGPWFFLKSQLFGTFKKIFKLRSS